MRPVTRRPRRSAALLAAAKSFKLLRVDVTVQVAASGSVHVDELGDLAFGSALAPPPSGSSGGGGGGAL